MRRANRMTSVISTMITDMKMQAMRSREAGLGVSAERAIGTLVSV